MSRKDLTTQSMQGITVLCNALLRVTFLALGRHLFMTEEIGEDMEKMCEDRDEFVIDGDYQVESGELDSGWEVLILEGVIFTLAKILEVTAIHSLHILLS